jgi:hypothetical protein
MNDTICYQNLNQDILFELDKLQGPTHKRMKKRLTNELILFANDGAYINVECNIEKEHISITIILKNDENVYNFYITAWYPFRPPTRFKINYRNYNQYLVINSSKTKNELKEYNGINCLCCNSISSCQHWEPVITLQSFINEYKKIKKIRRDIINRVLAKKIIDKYLYPDINLFEWLF